MKAIKIILVAIVIGIIGFFVFKWTTGSGSANEKQLKVSTDVNPHPNKGEAKQEKFENEFWSLFGSKKKDDYYNLIKKYPDISSENPIRLFYKNHLSESKDFEKFKNTPNIKLDNAKKERDLKKLDEYLNEQ